MTTTLMVSADDLVNRLARSQAHGTRQMGFVNELLAGEAYKNRITVPGNGFGGQMEAISYGDSKVGSASFRSLKARLIANGFIFTTREFNRNGVAKIEMRFGA